MFIEKVDHLPEEIEKLREEDMVAYESSHGIEVNYRTFYFVIKDDQKNVVGVLHAYTAFAEVYVEDIWVKKEQRGKGYGRQLMQALEEHFKGQGFNNINLVTSTFQAPEFYQKCGFQVEFIRKNEKNPKLSKTFLVKFFNEEVENQGLV